MARKRSKAFKKYLIEGILIIFSVLLALSLNKALDSYAISQRKKIAEESIKKELTYNISILKPTLQTHTEIANRLDSLIKGRSDSLKNELYKNNIFNLAMVTNGRSLMDDLLSGTAWASAQSTGIIAEFSYEDVELLTQVYASQDLVMDKSLINIADLYFSGSVHNNENIDIVLTQFYLRFNELVGQERRLMKLYTTAIEKF